MGAEGTMSSGAEGGEQRGSSSSLGVGGLEIGTIVDDREGSMLEAIAESVCDPTHSGDLGRHDDLEYCEGDRVIGIPGL
jgi:hypothetical protein